MAPNHTWLESRAYSSPMTWHVSEHRGDAQALHHLEGSSLGRVVQVMDLTERAIALGSTQSEAIVNRPWALANEYSVIRRHSGGGLFAPGRRTTMVANNCQRCKAAWNGST